MTLLELTLETAIKEAGEFKDVRLSKEDAECVLALLKEQEPERVEIVDSDSGRTHWYVCGGCKTPINQGDRFCHECGKAVKWDDTGRTEGT